VIYRDLLKHSSIYGLGQILSRIASILLLPLYTNYLSPAQYGTINLLDITIGLLAMLVGAGMSSAVSRYHFETDDPSERNRVWGSGFIFLALTSTLALAVAWLFRDQLAILTLGKDEPNGGYFYSLTLATLWFNVLAELANTYLRVHKWSVLYLACSVGRLLFNIALNVLFLVVLQRGVAGILLGNLCAAAASAGVLLAVVAFSERRLAFRWSLMGKLLHFGAPLIGTALLGWLIHSGDRYILVHWVSKEQVGIYALASQMGQGINTLFHMPFVFIWTVVIYEIAKQPNAKEIYARVFDCYVSLLALIMLGVSLFAGPILRVLAAEDYSSAADLVPIVCLSYLLFSMHKHFEVPALLAKRTVSMLPSSLVAAALTIGLNWLLIPWWGILAAAWVRVAAFAAFSFVGLLIYRRIDRYDYPLLRIGVRLAGMMATYLGLRPLGQLGVPPLAIWAVSAFAWMAWAILLFGPLLWQVYRTWQVSRLEAGRALGGRGQLVAALETVLEK
jgi:O-antigen/teichoic acid export membrane protein